MLSVNKKSFNDLCGLRSWDRAGGLVGGGVVTKDWRGYKGESRGRIAGGDGGGITVV